MAVGTVFLAAAGGLLNAFVLLPAYAAAFGMPMDALVGMGSAVNKAITSLPTFVLFAVVPFNIIKGVVVSLVTMLLYTSTSSRLLKGGTDAIGYQHRKLKRSCTLIAAKGVASKMLAHFISYRDWR